MQRSGYSARFLAVAGLFVTCLIVSNIIAVKLIEVHGFVLTAATVIFPVSYIIGDVLTEVYGYARARRVIWLGFACNLVAVIAIWVGGLLPGAGFWDGQEAWNRILGFTPRLLAASFAAYLVGEFLNSFVLAKMKLATNGRYLWTRTIGSTLVGQLADTGIFVTAAFGGVVPLEVLLNTAGTEWVAKVGYEVLATPLTYLVVGWLKRAEGVDYYDRDTRFNPLVLAD
ncbi:MAG: queuosine precursor transporter [Pseudomonadota bacterium]